MASSKKDSNNIKLIADNRKARHNYTITRDFEAGIILMGSEVKSLRNARANIKDSYAAEYQGEIWLYNLHIAEYSMASWGGHNPTRPRKLLLHSYEIKKLIGELKVKGTTLIPLSLYFNEKGIAKVKLGVAIGKRKYEKREAEKERDWKRDKARIMKGE